MPKGLFTQGVTVLLERPVSLERVAAALPTRELVPHDPLEGGSPWMGAASLLGALECHDEGHLLLDVIDARWPDGMGHPEHEPELFAAWSMGYFGPYAFPGNLDRAVTQPTGVPDVDERVRRHRAILRLRTSYVIGKGDDEPLLPEAYDPRAELEELDAVLLALLDLPEALLAFNPNGEVLSSKQSLAESLDYHARADLPALPSWSQVRLVRLEQAPGWLLMDTVGMQQLDVPDHEACFAEDAYELDEVAGFVRNASLYVLQNGEVIRDGHTMDGPGGRTWRARSFDESLAPAPRRVLRWIPDDARPVPTYLAGPAEPPPEPPS